MRIKNIVARQILDSRGNPTIETDVVLENGTTGRAAVPSGASTGANEAVELWDGNPSRFLGRGVNKAIENVQGEIMAAIANIPAEDQEGIDKKMIELDGTENKSRLGANAILSVSLACAKAAANSTSTPLFKYLAKMAGTEEKISLPLPMMNVINGGRHADFASDFQEFMILPIGGSKFSEALRMGVEVFHHLGAVIKERGYEITVGDEGGYAPKVKSGNTEPLEMISVAVKKAGYELGKDIVLGLDVAASELFADGKYKLKADNKELTTDEMIGRLENLRQNYQIKSIEDGLSESDWQGWQKLTEKMGSSCQLVGDDLLVTNTNFLKKAIDEKCGNAILVKLNQIGTLTETIQAVKMAETAGWKAIISHRSGETEDTTIAHLAVGLGVGQIKTGSLSRTERTAKYNELLRIEEMLGGKAVFAGSGGVLSWALV